MKEKNFYNEIGNWDFSKINYETQTTSGWNIYKEIEKYTTSKSICLDLGTGGGENIIKNYPSVEKIIGTDYSKTMIKTAKENLKNSKRKNIEFKVMNNLKIEYPQESFDLISARHTAIDAKEIYRVLKNGGYVIIQGIDKEDCIELKKIFKRGQAYKDKKSISEIDLENLEKAELEIIKKEKIIEIEFYKTEKDLMKLLLKTPILNDFSKEKQKDVRLPIEKELFEKYTKKFREEKGIKLVRKLYGIVAKKK
ncbi:MAG: class I SAM-dependent methyltransferase [Clostridia bacterium]